MLWENQGPKEQWDPLALMDSRVKEVNKVIQGCLEPVAHQALLATQGSQVSLDPKDLRGFLGLPGNQGLKVNQELQEKL